MPTRAILPLLAFALLLAIAVLPGCGGKSTSPTAPGAATDVYADAIHGSDDGTGSALAPFRTLTRAIAAADSGIVIHVAPGTYDTTIGEHFPLVMKARQTLLGDPANAGNGPVPTLVQGVAVLPWTGTEVKAVTLIAAPGATVTGLQLGSPVYYDRHFAIVAHDAAVTIASNTILSSCFGGAQLELSGRSVVRDNWIANRGFGLRLYYCTDSIDVTGNLFSGPQVALDLMLPSGHARIDANQFTSAALTYISVQYGHPRITANAFKDGGAGLPYGAIYTTYDAAPLVRSNTFECGTGLHVTSGTPDLGTATDPGGNSFAAVTGAAIAHAGTATILAIGNTWAHDPPRAGTEVVFTGSGHVRYGTGTNQILP